MEGPGREGPEDVGDGLAGDGGEDRGAEEPLGQEVDQRRGRRGGLSLNAAGPPERGGEGGGLGRRGREAAWVPASPAQGASLGP